MIRFLPFQTLLALGATFVLAVPAVFGADLSSIYRDAQLHDSQLQGAKSELQATLEGREQISAAYYPTIALNANTLNNRSQTGSGPSDSYNSMGYGITLNQGLYHRDIIISAREIESGIAQGELGYALAEQGLILRVASAYFDILSAQDGLELAQAEKRAISQQLKQAKQRFDVGLSAITDVHEAQAGYDMVVAQEIAAQTALDNSREALREIVGKSVGKLSVLQPNLPLASPEPVDINHWIKLAFAENLTLKSQRVATETARLGIDKANAGHHPSLDLVGSYDYSDNLGNSGNQKRSSYVGLRFELPLYSGGYTSSKGRESNFRYQQAQYALEQQRRATESAVRSAFLGVTAGISQVKAYQQALSSNETAYEATQAGYDAGTRTTLDLLNSQREQFRSKRDYAQARYDYLLATLKLKEVVGALTESDLNQINYYLK
ncbi:MAG: TolC family outer membrane protein [Gammaproteobacteria bacterium]|nr:TolC family outer membrane protein [Gammaproteobacteria bacterium]